MALSYGEKGNPMLLAYEQVILYVHSGIYINGSLAADRVLAR